MTEQNVTTVLELIQDQLKGLEDFLAKTTSTLHGYDGSDEVKFVQKKEIYICLIFREGAHSVFSWTWGKPHVQASVAEKKLGGVPSC